MRGFPKSSTSDNGHESEAVQENGRDSEKGKKTQKNLDVHTELGITNRDDSASDSESVFSASDY